MTPILLLARLARLLVSGLGLASLVGSAWAQSAPPLRIDASPLRLGDEIHFALQGTPLSRGGLAIEIGASSSSPKPHLVLAGFSTNSVHLPFTLDGSGSAQLSLTLPPDSSLTGATLRARAWASGPSGIAISQPLRKTVFPPRVLILWNGDIFGGPPHVTSFDALGDSVEFAVSYTETIVDATWVSSLSRIAVLLFTGEIQLLDPETGEVVSSFQLPAPVPGSDARLQESPVPGRLQVREDSSFTNNLIGLRLIDLANGQTLGTFEGPVTRTLNIPGTTRLVVLESGELSVRDDLDNSTVWSGLPLPSSNGPSPD
ncbi:MAG TPA: hypothetical protein ENJ09_14250, partial [Planctomycetes bacterium]|nr:hypothetical protein [Planctomycetota bacterium]